MNGRVFTGEGDIGKFFFDMENSTPAYSDVGNAVWSPAKIRSIITVLLVNQVAVVNSE